MRYAVVSIFKGRHDGWMCFLQAAENNRKLGKSETATSKLKLELKVNVDIKLKAKINLSKCKLKAKVNSK